MIFRNLQFEYLLFLPFLLFGIFLVVRDMKRQRDFDKKSLVKMRNYKYSKKLSFLKKILLGLGFSLIFISILRPMWGVKKNIEEALGIDMVFTLDVSKSMRAIDMNIGSRNIDRLGMAKKMIENYVIDNPSNRYGLVIFAGEAFVSTPLTLDHSAFVTFLSDVSYSDISTQGTDLNKALDASIDRFAINDSEEDEQRSKSIVLISDGGEDMNGDIDNFVDTAKEMNIKIFTIGVGSTKGVPIPEGQDFFGRMNYKQFQGKTVKTKLYEKPLKDIARKTSGEYFHAKKENDLKKISKKIKNLQTSVIKRDLVGNKDDKYQYFLFPAFVFFMIYIFFDAFSFLGNNRILRLKNNFKKRFSKFYLLLFLIILSGCSSETLFRYYNKKGNDNFDKNYLKDAKANYQKALEYSQKSKYISENNQAIANYEMMDYQKSRERLEKNIYIHCEEEKNKYCDELYYNLGNTYYKLGEKEEQEEKKKELWDKAIASYQKTLELNPEDNQAQENIDFILSQLEQEKKEAEEAEMGDNQEMSDGDGNNASTTAQNKNAENGAENKDGESSKEGESAQGQKTDGEKKDGEASAMQEGDNENSDEAGKSGSASSENKQAQENNSQNAQLDDEMNAKIENYLSQMRENEKRAKQYFNQNPDANKRDNNFNSIFDNFFNMHNASNFSEKRNSTEKDW